MKIVLAMLIMTVSIARAEPSVACFKKDSPLTVQLSIQKELNNLAVTLAQVSEDDFKLLAYMSNSEIKAPKFQEMISVRKVDVMVYPNGKPDQTGESMHVLIEANHAVVFRNNLNYQFDTCNWHN